MAYPFKMDNNEFLFKLGQKIKILRAIKGVSQEKLAEQTDTDRGYLSNIESGKANPSIIYLRQLAIGLGCEIEDFFNFTI